MSSNTPDKYDWKTHGDFKIYYDTRLKRHYWTLGYFGGGAINIVTAYELAQDYAAMYDVPLESVVIDEVLRSRRFKQFKVIFSTTKHEPGAGDIKISEDVWGWLTD